MEKTPRTHKKKHSGGKPSGGQSPGSKSSGNRKSAKVTPARQAALKALKQVFGGLSLSAVQPQHIDTLEDRRDRALANELVNGVLRWRWQLEFYISQLLSKPLKAKDNEVQLILLLALYELTECRTPDYAIINEAVELVRKSGKKWAASLVNAVLRRFTREKEQLFAAVEKQQNKDSIRYSHPEWILQKIQSDWPHDWQKILEENNQRPVFWLRVNQQKYSAGQYLQLLSEQEIEAEASSLSDAALKLSHGLDVRTLPGFAEGAVSVQDAGAQLCAELLSVAGNQRVLDLCAAPGGKACHLLERHNDIQELVAVELEEKRMVRVRENLDRLQLNAELVVADARDYEKWWDGKPFDRILIDAPCSASGVIRRHPDIKSLRRESDIKPLQQLQREILAAAWQMLGAGGELLYITCSVFKDENQDQMADFFSGHSDAEELKIDVDDVAWGRACDYGRQLLPGESGADGFYFCRVKKRL